MKFKTVKYVIPKGAKLFKVDPLGYKLTAFNDTGKEIELSFREPVDKYSSPLWLMMCKICGELEMGSLDIDGKKEKICADCVAEKLFMLKWK